MWIKKPMMDLLLHKKTNLNDIIVLLRSTKFSPSGQGTKANRLIVQVCYVMERYKIPGILCELSLVDRCIYMRVCKHVVTFYIRAYL